MRLSKNYYSNCIIEAIKWKLKHKDYSFRFKFRNIFDFHLWCESRDYIIDWHGVNHRELRFLSRFFYKGYIRKVKKYRRNYNDIIG